MHLSVRRVPGERARAETRELGPLKILVAHASSVLPAAAGCVECGLTTCASRPYLYATVMYSPPTPDDNYTRLRYIYIYRQGE